MHRRLDDPLETGPRPDHRDHGAALRPWPVGEIEPRARTLEQGLGDEEAKPHADIIGRFLFPVLVGPRGDEGLAKLLQHVRREAGSVVGNETNRCGDTASSMRWLTDKRETMRSSCSPRPASSARISRQRSACARNSTRSCLLYTSPSPRD